jgi:hypothetical protein
MKRSSSRKESRKSWDARIREASVTPGDLRKAIEAVNALPEEDRSDFTARSIAVLKAFGMLSGKRFGRLHHSEMADIDKIVAVQSRIEAMAKLSKHKNFKLCSMDTNEQGCILINDTALKVAAEIPLYGKHAHFRPDEFFHRLLELSEEEGRA